LKSGPAFSGVWPQEIRFFSKDLSLLAPISPKNLEFPAGQVASWSSSYPGCGIYVCTGRGVILGRIGKQVVTLKPKDLVLIPSGAPVCWFAEKTDSSLLALHFLPSIMTVDMNGRELTAFCSAFWFGREGQVKVRSLGRETHDFITTRIQSMLDEQRASSGERGLKWKVYLGEILLAVLQSSQNRLIPGASLGSDQDWQRLPKVLDYLHKNCREDLYAEKILKDLNLPGDFLATAFPGIMGQRWNRYLLDYRIRLAAGLLRQRNARISFVAQECGFPTLSHFNASFRKTMGMAPREFHKKSGTGLTSIGSRGKSGSLRSKSFTLVELLVTISIIGLLAGLSIPAIKAARETGEVGGCMSNLRQLTTAILVASADNQGIIYSGPYWAFSNKSVTNGYLWTGGYVTDAKVFLCPHGRKSAPLWSGSPVCHYSINVTPGDLPGCDSLVLNRIKNPSKAIILFEEATTTTAQSDDSRAYMDTNSMPNTTGDAFLFTERNGLVNHRKKGCVSFYDGSAISLKTDEWVNMLNTRAKRQIYYAAP
jgi:prepilin-type N-terminal cleavage/methylation domain-containing protein